MSEIPRLLLAPVAEQAGLSVTLKMLSCDLDDKNIHCSVSWDYCNDPFGQTGLGKQCRPRSDCS